MTTTTYRLDCGHSAGVAGPLAKAGRAWCPTCRELRAVDLMAALEASFAPRPHEERPCAR